MSINKKIHKIYIAKYFVLRNKKKWTYIKRSTKFIPYHYKKKITAYFKNKTFTSNFLYLYICAFPFAMWAIVYLYNNVVLAMTMPI